jgi:hypothetical protein
MNICVAAEPFLQVRPPLLWRIIGKEHWRLLSGRSAFCRNGHRILMQTVGREPPEKTKKECFGQHKRARKCNCAMHTKFTGVFVGFFELIFGIS